MKKQKLKNIIAGLVLILLSITTIVYAESLSVQLSINSTKLEPNKTYTVNASISEISTLNGVDTIVATLKYDTEVFDKNTISISATNGWSPIYNEETGDLIIQKANKTNKKEVFLTISLKTKENLEVENTIISLDKIVVSGGRISDGGTGDLSIPLISLVLDKNNTEPENLADSSIKLENNTSNELTQDNIINNTKEITKDNNRQLELSEQDKDQIQNHSNKIKVLIVLVIIIALLGTVGGIVFIKLKGSMIYK